MANKKTNKYVQSKKTTKPQPKKPVAKKVVKPAPMPKMPKKVEEVKKPRKQKTVRTKKVSVNSIPQPITYTEEVKAYKFGKYTVKKTHFWMAVAAVIVLLCIIF